MAEPEYGIQATPISPVRGPVADRAQAVGLLMVAQRVFTDARLMVREPGGEWRPADTEEAARG